MKISLCRQGAKVQPGQLSLSLNLDLGKLWGLENITHVPRATLKHLLILILFFRVQLRKKDSEGDQGAEPRLPALFNTLYSYEY